MGHFNSPVLIIALLFLLLFGSLLFLTVAVLIIRFMCQKERVLMPEAVYGHGVIIIFITVPLGFVSHVIHDSFYGKMTLFCPLIGAWLFIGGGLLIQQIRVKKQSREMDHKDNAPSDSK